MNKSIGKLLLAGVAAMVASPGVTADVTAERLTNADKEPHNWLMNHRTYDAQRYSPLEKINKGNIKNLKLCLCRRHRRDLGQREPAGDPARRGRLSLRRRPMGRGLQNRRPLG